MKFHVCLWSLLVLVFTAFSQTPVTLTIDSKPTGISIPDDFIGLSFEMRDVLPDADGGHFFRPDNKALVNTFKTLGVKSLRVGGNTADRPTMPVPNPQDADSLFAFARAADVKVIYTLRLREGNLSNAVVMARHIEQRHKQGLSCFALGNEPDVFAKEYIGYREIWKEYAAAILAESPNAVFCGPCATPTRVTWSSNFANDFARSNFVRMITQHDYPLGDARPATNVVVARHRMMAAGLAAQYENFHGRFAVSALANGLPFRLEEANSFYDAGAEGASDTYASALWALDFMHWWAAHGAGGINFHTGDKVAARDENKPCRYAVFWTSGKGYDVHPVGYGIKAFDLGGTGDSLKLNINKPNEFNLSAYAVRRGKHFFVTVINKEYGLPSRDAQVTLNLEGVLSGGQVMRLTAPQADISQKTGVTLGGAQIDDDGSWAGQWRKLKTEKGRLSVIVPAASAAVIRVETR